MRNLFLSTRSKPVLVACALMTSVLLGSNVSRAETCSSWHIDVLAQLGNATYDEDGNLIYAESTGAGHASHMGVFSSAGTNYFAPPANGTQVVDGDGIFTGANGDQIFVNFDGTILDLATGTSTGTYVVTGGTGRFEGATGSADLSGAVAPSGEFTVVADGALCF